MATSIFKLVGSIFVDNDAANKSIQKTDKNAEKMSTTFSKGITTAGKWGVGIAKAGIAMGAAVGTAIFALAETTREYRTEMAKLETAFETAEHSSKNAKDTYTELQGVIGDTSQAVEASNFIAKLASDEEDLAKWTNICTGVYGEFGNSLPIEGLMEAANETAKTGKVTGSMADALNWAGESEDAFNQKLAACSTEQERQQLIMNTLNGVYDESAEKYRENASEVIAANTAQEKLTSTLATLGGVAEPIVTALKEGFVILLQNMQPAIEYIATNVVPWLQINLPIALEYLQIAFGLVVIAITGICDGFMYAVELGQSFIDWIINNQEIITFFAIIVGTLTIAILAHNAQKIIKIALDAAETAAIWLLIAAENAHTIASTIAATATTIFGAAMSFLLSPITLVILAIGAIIAVIYLLVTNWDAVKETAANVWEKIKQTWNGVASWFNDKVIKPVVNFFSNMFKPIANTFDSIKTKVESVFNGARDFIENAIDKIKSFFDFSWDLPKIKLPHVKIKGEFSLVPPKVPSFGIEWYKDGGIMNEPTMFGFNPFTNKAMVGGEAGPEAIAPISDLMHYVSEAVKAENGTLASKIDELIKMLEYYLKILVSQTNTQIYLDSGKLVGELRDEIDMQLGKLKRYKERGI